MLYKKKGTELFFNVTNPDLLPLYEGNEAYEKVEEKKEEPAKEAKPVKKATTKK